MYQIVRKGGHLDSEFFPESIDRRSWPDPEAYSKFLRTRRVDFVIVFDSYDKSLPHQRARAPRPDVGRRARGLQRATRRSRTAASKATHFDVYSVRRDC